MKYNSTKGRDGGYSASQVMIKGIADDGGLFVPESIPALTAEERAKLPHMSYQEAANCVLSKYLTDFTPMEIAECVDAAYSESAFDGGIAPVVSLKNGVQVLELWHGPTSAFKDMALQLMPHLLVTSLRKQGVTDTAVILVATSGDTGKAALAGFQDVPGVRVAVFYPEEGVSAVQKRQMTTQKGGNVAVAGIRGNFDDAQTAVKQIFADTEFASKLREKDLFLTSANSINWGRLVPQVVYYVYTCAQLQRRGVLKADETIDVCVPTGNFGNILAAYYAKQMGAPIGRLVCASNCNNVLTDFIETGTYNRNRAFSKTISPSMDILISSNLERLLYTLSGEDGAQIAAYMQQLAETGQYAVSAEIKTQLDALFTAGFCDDKATLQEIGHVWREQHYLLDPHTAVASAVLRQYQAASGRSAPALLVATANPYKFAADVMCALSDASAVTGLEAIAALQAATNLPLPAGLRDLAALPILHRDVIDPKDGEAWLLQKLQ